MKPTILTLALCLLPIKAGADSLPQHNDVKVYDSKTGTFTWQPYDPLWEIATMGDVRHMIDSALGEHNYSLRVHDSVIIIHRGDGIMLGLTRPDSCAVVDTTRCRQGPLFGGSWGVHSIDTVGWRNCHD